MKAHLAGSLSVVPLPQTLTDNTRGKKPPSELLLIIWKQAEGDLKLSSLLLSDFTKVLEHTPGYVSVKLNSETITFILRPSEKFTTPFKINEDVFKVSEVWHHCTPGTDFDIT